MIIPANFNIATLFPCCAIRVMRPAEPLMFVDRLEKISLCVIGSLASFLNASSATSWKSLPNSQ